MSSASKTATGYPGLGKIRYRMGLAGYPTLRVMALAETGTRGLLGTTVGSADDRDEPHLARRLLPLLGPGMLGPAGPGLRRQRLPYRHGPHRRDAAGIASDTVGDFRAVLGCSIGLAALCVSSAALVSGRGLAPRGRRAAARHPVFRH